MRALTLVALLAISTFAAAEDHQYIVPMAGYMVTDDNTYYYATTVLQNLSPRDASVIATDVFGMGTPCAALAPFVIPARGRVTLDPGVCMANASAMSILSTEKLTVRTELDSHKTLVAGWDKQLIDGPSDWIAAGVTTISEAVIREDGPRKANLFVINPGEETLTLTIEMERPELDRSSTTTVDVPARSIRFVNLPEVRQVNPPPFIFSLDGRHIVKITGSGPWQGGVSSIYKGPSMYVPATALEP